MKPKYYDLPQHRRTKVLFVEDIRQHINGLLASDSLTQEEKSTLCTLLERVLMSTSNYHGFNYIHWIFEGGFDQWVQDGKPEGGVDITWEEKQERYLGPEYDRFYY